MKHTSKPKTNPGRPPSLSGGKRVNVYLDAASIKAADKLGGGNVSEGIRKSLLACSKC
jgi:hypothetical protein